MSRTHATANASRRQAPRGKCGCGKPLRADGGECDACRAQRQERERAELAAGALRGPGRPLDTEARQAFGAWFGHDFSGVRVHDDAATRRAGQAAGARAWTFGPAIGFAEGAYRPASREGRRLLAHELSHVVQQRGAGPAMALPSPGWAEERAAEHAAASWEAGRSAPAQPAAAATVRFAPAPGAAPAPAPAPAPAAPAPAPAAPAGPVLALSACAGQNAKDAAAAETLMGQWLTKAIADLNGFVGAPADAAHAKTAAALTVHFRRSDADLGAAIVARLKLVQAAFSKGSGSQCADLTHPSCQAGADGFASRKDGSVGLCPLYFTEPVETQANTLLHEGMHLHGAAHAIPDRAYSHARQYAVLTPEEAFDNADSYSNLVEDMVLGAGSAVKGAAAPPTDMVVGCDATQQGKAGRALGFVQKWMDPAFEAVSDPALSSQALVQDEVKRHLGNSTQATLDKAKVAYAHIGMAVTSSMSLTCDAAGPACPAGEPVRVDMAKGVVHFCPDWFSINKDEFRAEHLFDELLQERAKISEADTPSYVALARALFGVSFAAPPAIPVRPPPAPAPAKGATP